MAGRPGYGQPDPHNPFAGASPYSQPSRQYSVDSVGSDHYNSRNASEVPLNGPYSGQYTPQCKSMYACCTVLHMQQERVARWCCSDIQLSFLTINIKAEY